MKLKRLPCVADGAPFPVYDDQVMRLLAAHVPGGTPGPESRDAAVAHVLGTCATYAYADPTTVATVMARLGLEDWRWWSAPGSAPPRATRWESTGRSTTSTSSRHRVTSRSSESARDGGFSW